MSAAIEGLVEYFVRLYDQYCTANGASRKELCTVVKVVHEVTYTGQFEEWLLYVVTLQTGDGRTGRFVGSIEGSETPDQLHDLCSGKTSEVRAKFRNDVRKPDKIIVSEVLWWES